MTQVTVRQVEQLIPAAWKVANRYRHRLPDHTVDLDDCHQVAMIGVIKACRTWRPDAGSSLLTWAIEHADYEVRRWLRDHVQGRRYGMELRVAGSLDDHDDEHPGLHELTPAPDPVLDLESRVVLMDALRRLPRHESAALLATTVGFSQREIAQAQDVAQMTVSRRVRRATDQMRGTPGIEALAA